MTRTSSRVRLFVYCLCVSLAVPPGWMGAMLNARTPAIPSAPLSSPFTAFRPQVLSATRSRHVNSTRAKMLLGANPNTSGERRRRSDVPLELSNGALPNWREVDYRMPTQGPDVSIRREFRDRDYDGFFGNWQCVLLDPIVFDGSVANVPEPGGVVPYAYDSVEQTFTTPVGRTSTLTIGSQQLGPDVLILTDRFGTQRVFDLGGDAEAIIDRAQRRVDIYRFGNWLMRVESHEGVTYDLDLDGGLVTAVRENGWNLSDPGNNRTWLYEYDSQNRLTSVRTPTVDWSGTDDDYLAGKTTEYAYAGLGYLQSISQPGDVASAGAPTWEWEYDDPWSTAAKVSRYYIAGNAYDLLHGSSPPSVQITSPESRVRKYSLDAAGRITRLERDPAGLALSTSWAYDSQGRVTLAVFPKGNRVKYQYNASGLVKTRAFLRSPSDLNPLVWSYTYNSTGQMTSKTGANGATAFYLYDANGRLTTYAAPLGDAVGLDLNSNGIDDSISIDNWEYDAYGNLTKHIDASGVVTEHTYIKSKNPDVTDPMLLETTTKGTGSNTQTYAIYEYDDLDWLTKKHEIGEQEQQLAYNALGQIMEITGLNGATWSASYDVNNKMTTVRASSSAKFGDGLHVIDRTYDAVGRLIEVIEDVDSVERVTTFYDFDQDGVRSGHRTSVGEETEYLCDAAGRQTLVRTLVDAGSWAETFTTYDANSNAISRTRPGSGGLASVGEFDGLDRLTAHVMEDGSKVVQSYGSGMLPVSRQVIESPLKGGGELSFVLNDYDSQGRVVRVSTRATLADGVTPMGTGWLVAKFSRDEEGRLTQEEGACGCLRQRYSRDELGRLTRTQWFAGGASTPELDEIFEYDADGDLTKQITASESSDLAVASGVTVTRVLEYDQAHRMTALHHEAPSGLVDVVENDYGLDGRRIATTGGDGNTLVSEVDEIGRPRVAYVTDHVSDVTRQVWVYDDVARRSTMISGSGTLEERSAILQWGLAGQLVQVDEGGGVTTDYEYDEAARLTAAVFAPGNRVSYSYTPRGDIEVHDSYVGSSLVKSVTKGYDGMRRVVSGSTLEDDGYTSEVRRELNSLNLLDRETQVINGFLSGNGLSIDYSYNGIGQLVGVSYPGSSNSVGYEYDALGRVSRVVRNGTDLANFEWIGYSESRRSSPAGRADTAYDDEFAVEGRSYYVGSQLYGEFAYHRDGVGRITGRGARWFDPVSGSQVVADKWDQSAAYSYDIAGRLVGELSGVSWADAGLSFAALQSAGAYVEQLQLLRDGVGNVTAAHRGASSTLATYGAANVLQSDAVGSWLSNAFEVLESAGASLVQRLSDASGLPYQSVKPDAAGQPIEYRWRFDAFGRWIERQKRLPGGSFSGSNSIRHYYDGNQLIRRVRYKPNFGLEDPVRSYYYGKSIDDLLAFSNDAAGSPLYYVQLDERRSPVGYSWVGGGLQETIKYDGSGRRVFADATGARQLGSGIGSSVGLSGHHVIGTLSESGEEWYLARARLLRVADWPAFTSRDRAGWVDTLNRYEYVAGDPVNLIDSSGFAAGAYDNIKSPYYRAKTRQKVAAVWEVADRRTPWWQGDGAILARSLEIGFAAKELHDSSIARGYGYAEGVVRDILDAREVEVEKGNLTTAEGVILYQDLLEAPRKEVVGLGNALTHCIGACELMLLLENENDANTILDGNELSDEDIDDMAESEAESRPDAELSPEDVAEGEKADKETDQHNNKVGVNIAKLILEGVLPLPLNDSGFGQCVEPGLAELLEITSQAHENDNRLAGEEPGPCDAPCAKAATNGIVGSGEPALDVGTASGGSLTGIATGGK